MECGVLLGTFQAGDRILTGRNEYGSAVLAYLHLAQRTGAESSSSRTTRRPDRHRRARRSDRRANQADRTDVGTHRGGLVNPAADVGRLARAADVLFLLDATQAVGQFPINV